jgi:hypothetical protein
MKLNLALFLETNKFTDITFAEIDSFVNRVQSDGGTFEASNCLYNTLNSLGGFNGIGNVYERIDLFNDETISITQVIQDVKDISLIFTNFTKTFTIPATDENNRLFKHYYNYDIDGGFDARIKINGYIEIDSNRFNSGKVKLEGVEMKNNQPYAYKITYYGDTINLKDVIGEDKLNALDFSNYDLPYNSTNVKAKLQANPATTDIVAPFISHTNRYYYDSSSPHTEDPRNLYFQSGGAHEHGLLWSDLKYAIRLDAIVQQIGTHYGLIFSDDFFNSSNLDYYNLFMWLHRSKGAVQGAEGGILPPELINNWANVGFPIYANIVNSNTLHVEQFNPYNDFFNIVNINTASTTPYKFSILKNGALFYQSDELTGTQSFNIPITFTGGDYTFYIQCQSAITINSITLDLTYFSGGSFFTDSFSAGMFNTNNAFIFNISQQIPEMKVLDFLRGIFQMFNLTAYVENGIVVVKTLNDFYATAEVFDITQYIKVDSNSVNVALPFKQIEFGYEDTKTLLALKHSQQFNYDWAKEIYNELPEIDGGIYKVTLPFSHFKYERLFDLKPPTTLTDIQWGYSANDNFNSATGNYEAALGKPLLFYPILVTGVTNMSFRPSTSTHENITSYIAPSNSRSFDPGVSVSNINFKAELNEWTFSNNFTDTLFLKYYQDYILQVFNPKNRLTKIKAILPLSVLLNFELNDRFKIGDRLFRINKITTNLTNGESDMELLNEL